MDRWTSTSIQCAGGLVLNIDALTQGSTLPGTARVLQNFEPSIDGGYRRINGFVKFDDDQVPGDADEPVLGVKVALGGVFAVRKDTLDNAVYYSNGSGWSAALNGTARNNAVSKARFIAYSISEPVVILTDGANPAWKYDGATEALINGTGAPTDPKYAALFRNRLVLSGYSANTSAVSLSAPNDDEDFDGTNDAIEINVGDVVTGLFTFRETLYIFCENSIKKLVGSTTSDFAIDNVSLRIGCISHDSIQEVGGDVVFLSIDGIRSLAATERTNDIELGLLSTQIQPLVAPVLSQGFTEDDFSSLVIRKKGQYRLFLNDQDVEEGDTIGFLGKFEGRAAANTTANQNAIVYSWATMRGIRPYCSDSAYTNNQEYVVFGHPDNGYVYRLESGNTFDGTNIQAIYRTPDITFSSDKSDGTIRKVFHKLSLFSQVEGDVEFLVNLKLDRDGTNVLQPDAIGIEQTGALPLYGTAVYGTDTYGEIIYPIFHTNLIGSGFTGAFLYTCDNDSAPFRIDSFQVTLAVKGRR